MATDPRAAPLVRIAIIGVTGRMGQALVRVAPGFPRIILTGAIASPASLALGRDAGELAGLGPTRLIVSSDLPRALADADVAIDFSQSAATRANLEACRAAHKALLIGTTGIEAGFEAALAGAAREIAVLVAPNTSIAVGLLTELVRASARALPATFDIDILEMHHRGKRDAPSGTALALRAAAASGRGAPEGEIRTASVRAGDLPGEHTVLFSGTGEQLTLSHRASDRAIFARGALTAALWLASKGPGHYSMQDFISDKT
ncbi:MAG TPA: 4-hydroxy-tetrahydrodipicolinate reductase [Steroidobacteraceae bacterium]|nr:4-hydroxy-tetrahydrodipicolinate reductase [Steroidobacteraceae bacterium]